MIKVKESGWLEFDVFNAVQMGQHHKNLRLVVELENEDKLSLDAKQYFDINFCPSESSNSKHTLHDIIFHYFFSTGSNSNATLPLVHIPLLEICLLESSQTQKEMEIEEFLLSLKPSEEQNEDIPLTPTNILNIQGEEELVQSPERDIIT
jgi:hypothetical protein